MPLTRSLSCIALFMALAACGRSLTVVEGVEAQPLLVHQQRLREAMDFLGSPLSTETKAKLDAAAKADDANAARLVQEALDDYCLLTLHIDSAGQITTAPGPASPQLVERGWRLYLVKVHNEKGSKEILNPVCTQAQPVYTSQLARAFFGKQAADSAKPQDVKDRWLEIQPFTGRPLALNLAGTKLEYRIVQLYSRDPGQLHADIGFELIKPEVVQGQPNRPKLTTIAKTEQPASITFTAAVSKELTFHVKDENGQPAMAAFTITDAQGRVYPSQAKRLAPDFFFQAQVYRGEGETVTLPPGQYNIKVERGPEYLIQKQTLTMGDQPQEFAVELRRWIDPSKQGWWSGDHHIHAAGCAHYDQPTEGVLAKDMARHIAGEDLKVGANLTWGPCFDYQKQFFTGIDDPASKYPYILRYDIEVSGFGSHQSGHLVLLRLKHQIPPGGESNKHWPTLGLNTLKWAKAQGAVCGPAHSGSGLDLKSPKVLSYEIPAYNGIGANEYIVDVTHMVPGPDGKPIPAVDFISTVDTPHTSELNIWYHTLNCGFRTRISGETDFPCISGQRVGMGRVYAKVDGQLSYDGWTDSIAKGRSYVGDGRSHIIDFTVNGTEVGSKGSEVQASGSTEITATAKVAALLPEQPADKGERPLAWHVENARIPGTRNVTLELVVNGQPVAQKIITADGGMQQVKFDGVRVERSSWVAMRILPSAHTNPVFVIVDGKPIRASKKSADWCLKGVDVCWSQKEKFYDKDEHADAVAAYDHARKTYQAILQESDVE